MQWLIDRLIATYQKDASKPVIVITGDITDSGTSSQYREAQRLLSLLHAAGFLVLSCPGNHDVGLKGNLAATPALHRFGEAVLGISTYPNFPLVQCQSGFEGMIRQVVFIALDSMEGEMQGLDVLFAEGEIGGRQRTAVSTCLDKYPQATFLVIVFCHHHPFYYSYFLRLKDARAFINILVGQIAMLLFGHRHVERRFQNKERKYHIPFIHAAGSTVKLDFTKKGKALFRIPEITITEQYGENGEICTSYTLSPLNLSTIS